MPALSAVVMMPIALLATANPHTPPTAAMIPKVEIAPNVHLPMLTMGGVVQANYPDPSNYSMWLDLGGRGFDSAWEYGTQEAIAAAIKASGLPRSEIFITTKIPGSIHNGCCGCPNALPAPNCAHCHGTPGVDPYACFPTAGFYTAANATNYIKTDLELLGSAVGYIDLLLLHEPCDYLAPYAYNASKETSAVYGAMEEAFHSADPAFAGKIKAIGVSNFNAQMLTLLAQTNPRTTPAVNQCRMTVGEYDQASHEYCVAHNITCQAYSTLHGQGAKLPAVVAAAAAHAVSPQSVMMRWITQLGIPVVSASNISAYDLDDIAMFTYNLTAAEMAAISAAEPPPPSGKCDANPTCAGVTAKTCIASGCKKCSNTPPWKSCGSCGCAACCEGCKLTDFGTGQTYCAPQKGAESSWHRPEFAQQKHTISTLLVTEADGGEGFDMSMTLINISQSSSSKFVVVAGVVNLSSSNAQALQGVGAELRLVADPPSASVFAGVDWVLLMPADNGAYDRAPGLIKAANDARVSNALMISIMDVSGHAPTPPAQWPYFEVEQHLAATWGNPASGKPLEGRPAAAFAVLRTYFFQEHLLLWSQDVRATAHLRLPLETACFAPLHQDDGAAVVASMANFSVNMALPFRGKIFNLTGPQVFGGPELAQIAAAAIPLPGLAFTEVDRRSADRILNATGNPGVDGLLDLLGSQTTNCVGLPSADFHTIVGREPSSISNFFAINADAFRPAA